MARKHASRFIHTLPLDLPHHPRCTRTVVALSSHVRKPEFGQQLTEGGRRSVRGWALNLHLTLKILPRGRRLHSSVLEAWQAASLLMDC